MASSSWQHLGEGFSSNDQSNHHTNSIESCFPRRRLGIRTPLNHQDLLSSSCLPANKDSSSVQHEDISWSSSSSDEEQGGKKFTNKIIFDKKLSSAVKRKPIIGSVFSSTSKSLKCESEASRRHNYLKGKNRLNRSSSTVSDFSMLDVEKKAVKSKTIHASWSVSTFDEITINSKIPVLSNVSLQKAKRVRQSDNLSSVIKVEDVTITDPESSSESDNENINDQLEEDSDDNVIIGDSDSLQSMTGTKTSSRNCLLSQEKKDNNIDINSLPSSDGGDLPSQKVGASDWAIRFQQEISPRSIDGKDHKTNTTSIQHDSSRKKHKFSRNSLVGQLSRLIGREKSSMRLWQHSVSKGTLDSEMSSKSIILEIVSMSRQFSLFVSQCNVIKDKHLLLRVKKCRMMFVKSMVEALKFESGHLIKVFPPWKQLDEGERTTILCASQIRTVSNSQNSQVQNMSFNSNNLPINCHLKPGSVKEKTIEIAFKWACPCKQNSSLRTNQCPACQSDHYTNFFSRVALPNTSSTFTHSCHLHSVKSSGLPLSHHRLQSAIHGSLLRSIQEERAGVDCMPPFMATVLRVFRRVLSHKAVRLSVLLEDSSGTLALVQQDEIDRSSHTTLWSDWYCLEGRECICQCLTMLTRTTEDKDPSLFQVIGHVWKGRKPQDHSQDSSYSQSPQLPQKFPSFCYILQRVEEAESWLEVADNQGFPRKEFDSLSQAVQENICHKRISCVAKVMDVQPCLPESSESSGLFVCDNGGTISMFHPLVVDKKCVPLGQHVGRKPHTCFLQDVIWNGNEFQADEYSTLLLQSAWCKLGIENLMDTDMVDLVPRYKMTAPSLTQSNEKHFFVKVSGHIVNIDANMCYSWEACGECGSELTAVNNTCTPVCPSCEKEISQPVMQMNMEVEIHEDFCRECAVKINLSSPTISLLLPSDIPDEGYDMDQVLGKPITAMAYVIERKDDLVRLYQVDV